MTPRVTVCFTSPGKHHGTARLVRFCSGVIPSVGMLQIVQPYITYSLRHLYQRSYGKVNGFRILCDHRRCMYFDRQLQSEYLDFESLVFI